MPSRLVNRNVTVSGHRTSMRLEPELWDALAEIAAREGRTVNEICTEVDGRRRESTLTGAIRVFIVTYFRAWAQQSEGGTETKPPRTRPDRTRNPAPRRRGGSPPSGSCSSHAKPGKASTLGIGTPPLIL